MGWDYEQEERDAVRRENREWSDEQSRIAERIERQPRLLADLMEEAKRQLEDRVDSIEVYPVGDRALLSVCVDGETFAVSGDLEAEDNDLPTVIGAFLDLYEGRPE